MNKMWIVARHEYLVNLRKPSFLFTAFGVPIFVMVLWAVIFAIVGNEGNIAELGRIGIVDLANLVNPTVDQTEFFESELINYPDKESAQIALDDKIIGTFFLIPLDYIENGEVEVYAYGSTPRAFQTAVIDFLQKNLVSEIDAQYMPERLQYPIEMTATLLDTGRELTQASILGLILVPMIFLIVMMTAAQLAGGFLMSGVVEEKSNRIIEVLITSISPMQMLTGKLIGLGALGLTQILAWMGVAILVGALSNSLEFLSNIYIPPDLILLTLIYFVLTYFFQGSIMAGIGVVVGNEEESRQYVSIFSLVTVIPFFFIIQFMDNPNGPIPVFLSIFPLTAGIATIMRIGFGSMSILELSLSISLLLLTTIFVTWAAAKIFRWGTLMYGKKPSIREIIRVIRGPAYVETVAAVVREN